ncbi:MAG: glutamate 5-kinase [Blastocatellia bacterium]|nr:glutamate 5-kinase [Blastocatellia bacterium]MBL8197076.1 glutamate 5-kinase [Blastocatellia bacterium]MBN8722409.1 glutamate 5-kinase [Acidobacteriota bacterium]
MNKLDEAIRKHITNAQRIVIKIGTNVIMRDDGTIALGRIYNLIESVANLRKQNKEVLIVSSGAVGLGAQRLKLPQKPKQLILKQACAAIGQSRLMSVYEDAFEKLGVITAQILLIEDDFTNRIRYINLRDTILKLLEMGVVPIINENDTVSTLELERTVTAEQGKIPVFGDNDKLSALVMSKIFADMLIILSDVDGLYTSNPTKDKDATLIPVVPKITPEIEAIAEGAGLRGRGGMKTKIEAARIAINSGGLAVIVNGKALGILDRVLAGEAVGTVFLPVSHLSSKKRWIAFASTITGTVVTNSGAKSALLEKKASLLPAGVVYLEGNFDRGEVVSITDESGLEYARGIVNYSSEEAKKLIGIQSDKIEYLVAQKNYDALITRDNIVILS